ncbi:UBX domain-containing protein 1 isoform X1 [Morus notabilis]|uniref:UBX domain-containing protein 1 isoform X1 n=1 Tax=Morus notabilis TaxID=981085 RepID=UPI000CED3EA8|nr:UBX domain-containing protein 1 isoform X1 [Morus notabilis]XP_024026398.1 UBX domain-containing protein 1 isoform X1 [Morus notabilis]XP_024026399.1 UBX domain-containing protein 1 isoform X1 [Morus notabilis]XP_024026400.1 UBX domain-containing protein 1 isoform X1 [Morus notabilis]
MAVPKVNENLLGELESMGFPLARATRALHYSGNISIEDAVNWIVDHENDADIDQMPLETIDIGIDSDETFHMTEEMERKAQLLWDRARIKKEEEEKRLEREKEKVRIRSGKELIEAKRIAEENERKRNLALRQLEKEEEKRAREKIRWKLEQDKLERRSKLAMAPKNLAATKTSTTDEQEKQSSFPVKSFTKAELMRECLRSLKRNYMNDDARVRRAFQALLIYVGNVARNPNEEKYRKIRMNNPLFQERVGSLKGGVEFLELCGFERTTEGGEFLYLPRDKVKIAVLNSAGSELKSAITNPFFGLLSRKEDGSMNIHFM